MKSFEMCESFSSCVCIDTRATNEPKKNQRKELFQRVRGFSIGKQYIPKTLTVDTYGQESTHIDYTDTSAIQRVRERARKGEKTSLAVNFSKKNSQATFVP